jgi:hypothetical protein
MRTLLIETIEAQRLRVSTRTRGMESMGQPTNQNGDLPMHEHVARPKPRLAKPRGSLAGVQLNTEGSDTKHPGKRLLSVNP